MAINWLVVIGGTIGYQVLGALWYGPLLGSQWMAAMGYDDHSDMGGESPTMGYVITAMGALIATSSLAILVDWVGATTWQTGLVLGLIAGVGFVATTALQSVPFEGRSWSVYAINVGYNALALALIGVALAVL